MSGVPPSRLAVCAMKALRESPESHRPAVGEARDCSTEFALCSLQTSKSDDDERERNARRLRPTASKEGQ